MTDRDGDESLQCVFDECSNEWDDFAVARDESGAPAVFMVPVCDECLDSVGGYTEPLTFEAEHD